ncbi:MAG: hypothetical protein ACOYZ7_03645 [Chloroflexota bacterium]
MAPRKVVIVEERTWNVLQVRIERLMQEKVRLLDEWSKATKQAYLAPVPYRYDAIKNVGHRYSDLVDAVDAHINTLRAARGEFPSRIEQVLLRTGRQGIH